MTIFYSGKGHNELRMLVSFDSVLPLENELFDGRYRPCELLGQGGMGKVFLVEDTMLDGEKIALKVLNRELTQDENHKKRFLREVKLARQVTHVNVVRTYDVGVCGDYFYYTMEHIRGISLKDLLTRDGPLNEEQLTLIVPQICAGLHAIHQHDIVHRDLKPANVILTDEGVVKIADFGIARPGCSDLTHGDEIIGSSRYMAPEVWVGKPLSSATDIYALGVLLFEMCTGMTPFEADNPAELMWKHLDVPPIRPSEIEPKTPSWADALVLALMAKDDSHRPCDALEIAEFVRSRAFAPQKEGTQESSTWRNEGYIEAEPFISSPEEDLITSTIELDPPALTAPIHSSFPSGAAFVSPKSRRGHERPLKPLLTEIQNSFLQTVATIVMFGLVILFGPKLSRAGAITFAQVMGGDKQWLFFAMSLGVLFQGSLLLSVFHFSLRGSDTDAPTAIRNVLLAGVYLAFALLSFWLVDGGQSQALSEVIQSQANTMIALATLSFEHVFTSNGTLLNKCIFLAFLFPLTFWMTVRIWEDRIHGFYAFFLHAFLLLFAMAILSYIVAFMATQITPSVEPFRCDFSGVILSITRETIISGIVSITVLWGLFVRLRFLGRD
ncbi:MAG: serine/threonine protein kinase [Bdellovibrionales bacterium]|nr:serine/threonine protein kinase [Bdellovibrionales bacterium]